MLEKSRYNVVLLMEEAYKQQNSNSTYCPLGKDSEDLSKTNPRFGPRTGLPQIQNFIARPGSMYNSTWESKRASNRNTSPSTGGSGQEQISTLV